MYKLYVNGIENEHHYSELAREFFSDKEYEVVPLNIKNADTLALGEKSFLFNPHLDKDRDEIKRDVYNKLSKITGISPDWGTLTGVKPLKPAMNIYIEKNSLSDVRTALEHRYLLNKSKQDLMMEILDYQIINVSPPQKNMWSIYVSIPFCPSICSYCSFGSEIAKKKSIENYMPNLYKEIKYCGELYKSSDKSIESLYFGGGTPTSLDDRQLKTLFDTIESSFGIKISDIETTVEAGRPDTIDKAKLDAIRNAGVKRISINPQSMNDNTLKVIGRSHTSRDIKAAFRLAKSYNFDVINSDVIAGLPGEKAVDIENTINSLIDLGANNITVHTLSIKRGSKLKNNDPEYYLRGVNEVKSMLDIASTVLHKAGFVPYYIYRQKHQMGSFENTGWCKPLRHSLYNIRIMEEMQTVIGLGAGAIGKKYYQNENRLERIPNINDYRMYVERIQQILERKKKYFI